MHWIEDFKKEKNIFWCNGKIKEINIWFFSLQRKWIFLSRIFRSSPPEVFLGKGVLKICRKFTGEHPRRGAISIKSQSNFIEIAFRNGCSPVNLLHIFRTPFRNNTSGRLLLDIYVCVNKSVVSGEFKGNPQSRT